MLAWTRCGAVGEITPTAIRRPVERVPNIANIAHKLGSTFLLKTELSQDCNLLFEVAFKLNGT